MSLVPGSNWSASDGIWTLVSCPPAYVLENKVCQICPAACYCTGGSAPATPCGSGLFTPPGAVSAASCTPAVFVIITAALPILRHDFDDQESLLFQNALASITNRAAGYVMVVTIAQASTVSSTLVTSNIATVDANAAAVLKQQLDSNKFAVDLATHGFIGGELVSLQVTACPPGYELLPSLECQLCPANHICTDGSSVAELCPADSFAPPGSNSSASCVTVVYVLVVILLPVSQDNFTLQEQNKFQMALALAAAVPVEKAIIVTYNPVQSRRSRALSIKVNSEIAADDSSSADLVSSNLNPSRINSNLIAQGLPQGTLISVVVSNLQSAETNIYSQTFIGGIIGAFVCLLVIIAIGLKLYVPVKELYVRKALKLKLNKASVGDACSQLHLPDTLQDLYTAEQVLRKGDFGCFVRARSKKTGKLVAIKIIISESINGVFDEFESNQLHREAELLQLFTSKNCEHAVSQLVPADEKAGVHWFIMEFLAGDNMEIVMRSRSQRALANLEDFECSPVHDTECIQMALDVLVALRIMHAEDFVHRDIKPVNIIRCQATGSASRISNKQQFLFKIIDFGSSLKVEDSVAEKVALGNRRRISSGTFPYMSPEMFSEPENAASPADFWSLGVIMFEFLTFGLPFQASSEAQWFSVVAGSKDKAPSLLDRLDVGLRSKFDKNLAKLVAKALEKKISERFIILLLLICGSESFKIFNSLNFQRGDKEDFAHTTRVLTNPTLLSQLVLA